MSLAEPAKVFDFDPEQYREQYREQGWVHIKDGIDPDFLAYLASYTEHNLDAAKLDRFQIKGKKEQALFVFPEGRDHLSGMFDTIAALCGLNRPTMTLSERHIQAYDPDADPDPVAHKDRYPSQVSIGFSVRIPPGSELVLYPHDHRELNPYNVAATLRQRLQPYDRPETVLPHAREVVLHDAPGDVVIFPGSTTWHLRRRSANTVNLYLKVNDFDCDPLGEDPSTPLRRERTLALLAEPEEELRAHPVKMTRRMDHIGQQWLHDPGAPSAFATLYGEPSIGLTDVQLKLLRAADGTRSLGDAIGAVRGDADEASVMRDAKVLLEAGALDLL